MLFNFLPPKNLKDNIVNLVAAVNAEHEKTMQVLTDPRKTQLKLLDGLHASLEKYFNKLSVASPHSDLFQASTEKLSEENQINVTRLDTVNRQLQQLAVIPKLSEPQLELQKNLQCEKIALLNSINKSVRLIQESEARRLRMQTKLNILTDEQQSKIITGAFLLIKEQIEFEYSGALNVIIGIVKKNKPDNSTLYAAIDPAIGITAENKMDNVSKKQALAAYNQFVIMSKNLNVKLDDNVKDEEIVALVTAKHNLKKVMPGKRIVSSINRVEKARFENLKELDDSINTTLLLADPKLLTQATNRQLPAQTRKMITDQIAEYTSKDEIGRYYRDVNAETINRVLITKNKPDFAAIMPNSIVLHRNNRVLTAFWIKNGELVNKSFPENQVADIISMLPRKATNVFNVNLIKAIASQFGCQYSHSELSHLQMNNYLIQKLNISSINRVPGVSGKRDVLNADKNALIDNTDLNQENSKILDRVISKHKLKTPLETGADMVKETRYDDETKQAKVVIDVNHSEERTKMRKYFFEKTKAQIEGYSTRQLKHFVPKVSNKIQLTEDYDSKAKPILKKI